MGDELRVGQGFLVGEHHRRRRSLILALDQEEFKLLGAPFVPGDVAAIEERLAVQRLGALDDLHAPAGGEVHVFGRGHGSFHGGLGRFLLGSRRAAAAGQQGGGRQGNK